MMKQSKKLILSISLPIYRLRGFIFLITFWTLPHLLLAANPALNTLDNIASGNNGPYKAGMETDLAKIIGTVVGMALGLLGIIFLVLMLYAGYNWMTAKGEEEKVTEAKDTIIRAVTGLIIVIGSYAMWKFIFSKLF